MNDYSLSLIARYQEWNERFGLCVDAYLGLLYWYNPYVRDGFQEISFLNQLFGDDSLWILQYCSITSSEDGVYLQKTDSSDTRKVLSTNEIAALQRGLQMTQTDWGTVLRTIDPNKSRLFGWYSLAALQRLTLPLQLFGWSIQDAVQMLESIAPRLLNTLSGEDNGKELPPALDHLVWLGDTLTAWQATPAQITTSVRTPPKEALKATQETANWINDLYQNLLPALLNALSFEAYEKAPLDTPTEATSSVTIDWLAEMKQPTAAINVDGLVLNQLKPDFGSKVQIVLANNGASLATSIQDGVVATLLLAQSSAMAILSTAIAKVMSGAGDAVIPMLAWMNFEDPENAPIHYYTVLTRLLAWNLLNKREIDVSTLNQQSDTLTLLAFINRYAEAVRLFRLEKEDIQLLVEQPKVFDARERLSLNFVLLLTLGQLKGLQHDQASAGAWRMYFTRQAQVQTDDSRKALTDTLSQLLGCPVEELKS